MATIKIDAALELPGTSLTRFFAGPVSVTYNWDLTVARVADGPRLLTREFRGLPDAFAGGIDAVLSDPERRSGDGEVASLFRGTEYFRFNLRFEAPEPDPPATIPLSSLYLPQPMAAGLDAVLDGRRGFAGKRYFFRGDRYVAVNRASGDVEGGVRDLALWKLPFDAIDAATNGIGIGDGSAVVFRGEQYLAYDWTADAPIGNPIRIIDGWRGVLELLHAGRATVTAREWVAAALAALGPRGTAAPTAAITVAALEAHFKAGWRGVLDQIRANFATLDGRLAEMPARYRFRTRDEAVSDGAPGIAAYQASDVISFTPDFVPQTEMSQTAIVIHEMIHTFRPTSGDNEFIHVSEWELTRQVQVAAGVAMRRVTYPAQQTQHAVENPSAYAAFAQHVRFGVDTRFGQGRGDQDATRPFPGL